MKRRFKQILIVVALIIILQSTLFANAQGVTYTVKKGDSMWKIAVKYEIGISELIKANPQIKNPNLIYVGQKIYIPEASSLKSYEDEVVRLVNVEGQNTDCPHSNPTGSWQGVARYKSQDMMIKTTSHQSQHMVLHLI